VYRAASLFLPDPANRQHPLLRGCVGWWCGLPGRGGGPNWHGLTRGGAGAQQGGAGWSGNTRPGRLGACPTYVDTSSQCTDLRPVAGALSGQTAATAAFWCYRTSLKNNAVSHGAQSGNDRFALIWLNNDQFYAIVTSGATVGYAYKDLLGATGWHHLAMVYNYAAGAGANSRCKFYYDGVPQTLTLGAEPPSAIPTATAAWSGYYWTGTAHNYSTGPQDDVVFWNRALSAAEVRAWYDQSRRGHPDTLRRAPVSEFGTPFLPAFADGSVLVGSGVY
jgi:hypothetical protein